MSDDLVFHFYRGDEYLALPRSPTPWLIERLLPCAGVANLFGRAKEGKSYLSLGMALALADPTCKEWLGFPVMAHGPVMYLQVDTPRIEWQDRIAKLKAAGYRTDLVHWSDLNTVPYPTNLTDPAIKEHFKMAISAVSPLVVFIDTLREVHDGDENDSKAMKAIITAIVECTREVGAAVVLISHTRKDNVLKGSTKVEEGTENIMDDARGSSYVSGRMDVVMKLTAKNLILKGRSIGQTRIAIERDSLFMPVLNTTKAEQEQAITRLLLDSSYKSDRERAAVLATMEEIELSTARSRIQQYRKKHPEIAGAEETKK